MERAAQPRRRSSTEAAAKRGKKMSPLPSQPPDTHTIGTNLTVQYCGGWILPPPPPHVSSSSVPPLSDLLPTAVPLRRPSLLLLLLQPHLHNDFFPFWPSSLSLLPPVALIPSCVAVAPPPPPPPQTPRIWSGGLPEVVVGIKCFGGRRKEWMGIVR